MQTYDVLREYGCLELVAVINANNLEEAKAIAEKLGSGKEYRIEESEE